MGLKLELTRIMNNIQGNFTNKKLPQSVTDFRANEKKPWDRWAMETDKDTGGSHVLQRTLVEEFVGARPMGQIVVELGCGTGKIANEILNMRNVDQYVGFDVNAKAIKMAEEHIKGNPNAKKATFIHCSVSNKIPLNDLSATCVVGVGLFQELPDVSKTLKEVHRILRPGGLVVGDFDAQENSIAHFLKRYGVRKYLWLTLCHDVALTFSFNKKIFNWFGKRGAAKLMFYKRDDVVKLVSKDFSMDFINTFGYYHFFAAYKQ